MLPASTRHEIASESNVEEYPFPKEASRFLIHLLLEKEPYVPKLAPVDTGPESKPVEPREMLDPKVERKVKRALKFL